MHYSLKLSSTSHQMASGVGASWHSILQPPVGHGGSAFGGQPPLLAQHEPLWQSIEKHADWLALKFIRAEFEWRQFEPVRGDYTFDGAEMRILDRILSWAQRNGADVQLQCQWLGVAWQAFGEFAGDPALEINSAPRDLDAFAEGWAQLVRELVVRRGYTCIRWINLINEPGENWWHLPGTIAARGTPQSVAIQMAYLAAAIKKTRAVLKREKLNVAIMGPDETDLPVYESLAKEPWFEHVDDLDFHSYMGIFDFDDPAIRGGYRLNDRLVKTLIPYRAETKAAGKGLYLSEAGTMCFGWGGSHPGPGEFRSSLKDTELLIRSLALGIDGFSHWSFTNRGDVDGQWQLIDTWDRRFKQWLPLAIPHEAAYRVLGLAIRHIPKRALVFPVQVSGNNGPTPRVWAVAVRAPQKPGTTLLIVHDAEETVTIDIRLEQFSSKPMVMTSGGGAWEETYSESPSSGRLTVDGLALLIVTDSPLEKGEPGRF